MSRWFQRLFGRTDAFALSLAFDRDPHPGAGLTPAVERSYGELALWVRGACVTTTLRPGEGLAEGVSGHLLPLLSWLAERAVPMLNEEAWPLDAPDNERVAAAATWMGSSERPGLTLTPAEEDAWFDRRWAWWDRHALRAGLRGWAAPNLFIRRLGDEIELSWDHRAFGSVRPDLLFVHPEGTERLPATEVAAVLNLALEAAVEALSGPGLDLGPFPAQVAALASADAHAWLVPEPTRALVASAGLASQVWPSRARGALAPHSPATRLLRSARLTTEAELRALLALLDAPLGPWPAALEAARRPSPPTLARPWSDGYERALEVREALALGDAPVDMDAWTSALGLAVAGVDGRLSSGVLVADGRVAALASPQPSPATRVWARPMMLATAIGHLTMDPWSRDYAFLHGAHSDGLTAARAKAFGAMFLMPEPGVRRLLVARGTTAPLDLSDVRTVAATFGASTTSAAHHLRNLGLLTDTQRDALLAPAA